MPKKARLIAASLSKIPETSPSSQKTNKRVKSSFSNLKTLEAVRATELEQLKVKNTDKAYRGYITRGKKFLQEIVEERRKSKEECSEGIQTDILEKALDDPPNQYSATVIEMWITQKCLAEGRKIGVAIGIHAAFCRYWDEMGDSTGQYSGSYSIDPITQKVTGCPARAQGVQAVVNAVKTKSHSKGAAATRNHADAMTIEDITTLMQWSESMCPNEAFKQMPEDAGMLKLLTEHAMMRAFATAGFTLWTRNFELSSLQASDILYNCKGTAPYHIPHFKVTLEERKGWQKQSGYDGPRTGNIYDIYKQDLPEIDMYTHFQRWVGFVEQCIGHSLKNSDYIFPYCAPNGLLHPDRPMSYDMVQGLLAKFSIGAGLKKNYTTHCFRRGGAQYRFMYAPIGKRWSLNMVRWWGGWAVGEHVDTLIKYLVDSLQSFENGHGDALCPIQDRADESFMGDHTCTRPVTAAKMREFKQSLDRKIDQTLNMAITSLKVSHTNTTHAQLSLPQAPTSNCTSNQQLHVEIETQTSSTHALQVQTLSAHKPQLALTEPCQQQERAGKGAEQSLPIPGVVIPDLGHHADAWLRAIAQWEQPDPKTGYALKDWPIEWYTGPMRPFTGAKRTLRKTVAEEYKRFSRDDTAFCLAYPETGQSLTTLLQAIRRRHLRMRTSKNGSPLERNMSAASSSHDGSDNSHTASGSPPAEACSEC